MTIMTNLPKTGVYRHFKGNLYELLYIATDSETLEKKVVYRARFLCGAKRLLCRTARKRKDLLLRKKTQNNKTKSGLSRFQSAEPANV